MIGPFYLPVDIPVCLVGVLMGALIFAAVELISAGSFAARDARDEFIRLMTEECHLQRDGVVRALERGGSLWARCRALSRPLLWRLGADWPEFSPSESEFRAHYERELPRLEQQLAQLERGSNTLQPTSDEDAPGGWMQPSSDAGIPQEPQPETSGDF